MFPLQIISTCKGEEDSALPGSSDQPHQTGERAVLLADRSHDGAGQDEGPRLPPGQPGPGRQARNDGQVSPPGRPALTDQLSPVMSDMNVDEIKIFIRFLFERLFSLRILWEYFHLNFN